MSLWERPFTTRQYLHGPMAQYMFTLWADAKILCGEVEQGVNAASYQELVSASIWLLQGEHARKFNYKQVKHITRDDGIPIHGLEYECGDITVTLESFCNIGATPTSFTKITVKNNVPWTAHEQLWIMVRTAQEYSLLDGYGPDGYMHYAPDEQAWGRLYCGYKLNGNVLSDGKYSAYFQSDALPVSWQVNDKSEFRYQKRLLRIDVDLLPEEEKTLTFSFGRDAAEPFDYDEEKAAAIQYWNTELAKIKVFPEALQNSNSGYTMYRSLVAQILQSFCCPMNKDYVLARQGGLQRLIWPVETIPVLEALDTIGDYRDYVDKIIDLYFNVLQVKEGPEQGEVTNFGENWASVTSAALYSYSVHALHCDQATFNKHKNNAFAAFEWIERTRNSTKGSEHLANGLFPPMRSNDWDEQFQSWSMTDIMNLLSYEVLIKAFEQYNDSRTELVRAAYQDYLGCIRICYDKLLAESKSKGSDQLRIPLTPDGNDDVFIDNHPHNHESYFILAGVPYCREEEDMIERYVRDFRPFKNGLTDLFYVITNETYENHTWYTSFSDYPWFLIWLRQGEHDKAAEALKAQLKYSMTKEYYMIERYTDNDPYFVPWSPNASANGRTILMLCEFFKRSDAML